MPNFEKDRQEAIQWAQRILERNDVAIIDVETTNLYGMICEIGIIDKEGNTLFESLVNPECKVSPEAFAKHHLSDEMLASAPTLPQIWRQITDILGGKLLVAYNAVFEKERLLQSCTLYQLPPLHHRWECAMKAYARFYGAWHEYHQSYTWQPLRGPHRAIGDCLTCLGKIREMAACTEKED